MRNPIDYPTARKLAVEASCDPRTIRALVCGRPVRGLAGQRARAVLERAGLLKPIDAKPEEHSPASAA